MQMESVALTAFLFNKQPARAAHHGQPSSDFVGLRHTYSVSGEGTQYAYYKAGNSKVKNKGGSAVIWWGRSPYSGNGSRFCFVGSNGAANNGYADISRGVAFGFCV
jgi:hypothetical protein